MGLLSMLASIGADSLLQMSFSAAAGKICIRRVDRAARISCEDFRLCCEHARDQTMIVFGRGRMDCLP